MHACMLYIGTFSGTNYISYTYFTINGVDYSTLIDVTQRCYKFKNARGPHTGHIVLGFYALGNTHQISTIFHNISGVIAP